MRRFDERFARQYRYELPPEFPLASSYPSIDHHLSGPGKRAPTPALWQAAGWVDGAAAPSREAASHLVSLSLRVEGLPPERSHACWTPWSVFQDGTVGAITSASIGEQERRRRARTASQHAPVMNAVTCDTWQPRPLALWPRLDPSVGQRPRPAPLEARSPRAGNRTHLPPPNRCRHARPGDMATQEGNQS